MNIPLQYGHCYSTTYANSYGNRKPPTMDELRYGYKGNECINVRKYVANTYAIHPLYGQYIQVL